MLEVFLPVTLSRLCCNCQARYHPRLQFRKRLIGGSVRVRNAVTVLTEYALSRVKQCHGHTRSPLNSAGLGHGERHPPYALSALACDERVTCQVSY